MAFPVTITTQGKVTSGHGRPFLSSGGNVYVILQDDVTTSKLRAFKATDPSSSFSNVGTDPQVTSTNPIASMDVYQVGDNLHVATIDLSGTTASVRYHVFSMSSDSWTTTNEAVSTAINVASPTYVSVGIHVRSTGDIVILYSGPKAASMGTDYARVTYARKVSGVWTIDVAVDNAGGAVNWWCNGLVAGSSDRTHFFFIDATNSDAYQRCLRSANTLETFPSSYDTTAEPYANGGVSYDSSGTQKVRWIYQDSTANVFNVAKLNSADTPTVTTEQVATSVYTSAAPYKTDLAADGTNLFAAFIGSADLDLKRANNSNDGGWSAASTVYTGSVSNCSANIYTRNGSVVLAIVFTETDPKYTEYTIRTPGSDISAAATASVTWNSKSTAAAAASEVAAASVTWGGKGMYPAALSATAVASVTWTGAAVTVSAAALSAAATASVTWTGVTLYSSALSAAAVGSLTWNGVSTVATSWSSAGTAALTWNGQSFAATNLSAAAVATLTWNAAIVKHGDFSGAAVADLQWIGKSTKGAALDAAATASVTWTGAEVAGATASGEFSSAATAAVAWNGISTGASDWSGAAVAAVTWDGAAVAPNVEAGAWSSSAAAALAATGAATASAALSAAGVAALTWNGQAFAGTSLQAQAAASVTWEGIDVEAGSEWQSAATATAEFTSATIAAAAASFTATASATFTGSAVGEEAQQLFDGRWAREKRRRELELQEEEDIMLMMTAACAIMGYQS